jgi:hypothetical protein
VLVVAEIMRSVVYADRQAPLSYEHRITAIAHWLSGQAPYGDESLP